MAKEIINRTFYKDGDKIDLVVTFFYTSPKSAKRPSIAFRLGKDSKRWTKSIGPYKTIREAVFAFHSLKHKSMPELTRTDYSFFYNTSYEYPDGVVTLTLYKVNEDGGPDDFFYGTLRVVDKLIWSSMTMHTTYLDAFLEGYQTMKYMYPKVEPYE